MPERFLKYYYLRIQRIFRRLARSAGTPEHIALGAAIGMVVGMTPTVGMQMMICIPLCLLLRANPVAAVPIVWITNPFTIIPIYSFNYWIGTKIVSSGPRIVEFERRLGEVIRTSEEVGVWAGAKKLVGLGWDIQLPLWTGCFLVGFVLAVPIYFLFLKAVTHIRVRMDERKRMRQERVTQIIRKRLEDTGSFTPVAGGDDAATVESGPDVRHVDGVDNNKAGDGKTSLKDDEPNADCGTLDNHICEEAESVACKE